MGLCLLLLFLESKSFLHQMLLFILACLTLTISRFKVVETVWCFLEHSSNIKTSPIIPLPCNLYFYIQVSCMKFHITKYQLPRTFLYWFEWFWRWDLERWLWKTTSYSSLLPNHSALTWFTCSRYIPVYSPHRNRNIGVGCTLNTAIPRERVVIEQTILYLS